MKVELTRRGVVFGSAALLAGCSGRLHGYRRRLGFAVVNTRLLLHGEVTGRSAQEFDAVLDANPQITTVVLQDMPGVRDPGAAMSIGRNIRARELNTALQSDSEVMGTAVLIAMGGVQRTMVEGARIGLRDWSAPVVTQGYIREMLGNDAFYQLALQVAPSSEIHIMTTQEIARSGLLTSPVTVFE